MNINKFWSTYKNEIILLIILVVGFLFRIYALESESLWMDEGYSLMFAKPDVVSIIKINSSTIECLSNPPFYSIILHFFIGLFGESETALRMPSVIFGCMSIFMIYKVGTLLFDENVGLLGALILAFSKFHIYYSQEARSYTLQVFLILLSFYFFIKFFRKGNLIISIGYIISSLLLIFTHYFGVFIIFSQNIIFVTIFLLFNRKDKPKINHWISLQAILIILFSPWIYVLLRMMNQQKGKVWFVPPVKLLFYTFLDFSGSIILLFLFLILTFISVIFWLRKRNKSGSGKAKFNSFNNNLLENNSIYFLLIWMLIPILFPFIFSRFFRPIYMVRYTIGASLPLYLFAAKGIKSIGSYKSIKLSVIAIVLSLSFINLTQYYTTSYKDKWRETANYVDQNAKSGDLVLFNSGDNILVSFIFNYYSNRDDLVKKNFPESTEWVPIKNIINKLEPVVDGFKRIWVVVYRDRDPDFLIENKLKEEYNLIFHQKYIAGNPNLYDSGNINLFLFSKL